jgi:hypothetical protein
VRLVSANLPDLALVVIVSELVESVKKEIVGGTCLGFHTTYYRSNDSRRDATLLQQEKVYD